MKTRTILCFILILAMLFAPSNLCFSQTLPTASAKDIEAKRYSTATISDDFADNRVLIVLRNEESLKFTNYTASNFSEIDCEDVRDLAPYMRDVVKEKAEKAKHSSVKSDYYQKDILSYNRILCLDLKENSKTAVLNAIHKLEKREDILYVGPDYKLSLAETTSSSIYYDEQWGHEKIQLPSAWDITTGSSSVVVGVIDTGIDRTHPDLASNIATELSKDFTNNNTITGAAACVDEQGHGTHVAGIIAAKGSNFIGVSGVCWNVKVASLRVMGSNDGEGGNVSHFIEAVSYAESKNIPILNCSLSFFAPDNWAAQTVVSDYTGLMVCAAGNTNQNIDTAARHPASYTYTNILSVGNSTEADTRHTTSNYGDISVDLFAPGTGILSCFPGVLCADYSCVTIQNSVYNEHTYNGYHTITGTSMAAPYVAGVAVLLLSKYPNMEPCELKATIMNTVDGCGTTFDAECVSNGRLNAYRALSNPENHTISYDYFSGDTKHTVECDDCNFEYDEPHIYTYIESNEEEHLCICEKCSDSVESPHNWNYSMTICLDCGYCVR